MTYLLAWSIAVAAGLIGAVSLYFLTRGVRNRTLRWLLRLLPPLLLLVPAPVPGFAGNYAPAFIVFVFESIFQAEGKPLAALLILCLAAAAAALLAIGAGRLGISGSAGEKESN